MLITLTPTRFLTWHIESESESCSVLSDYWSGQPFPSPGDLPNPEIEPRPPALQVDSLPAEPQMGTIKERSGKDLIEAEDIKNRWPYYKEKLCKKGLNDPDNHNDVVTQLKPDFLDSEVKWAQEALLQTNLVEVMEFQLSYFKS